MQFSKYNVTLPQVTAKSDTPEAACTFNADLGDGGSELISIVPCEETPTPLACKSQRVVMSVTKKPRIWIESLLVQLINVCLASF